MRRGGSKQKGSGFERKICVALSQWLTKGKRRDLFWRSAMSGGRATLAHAKGIKLSTQGGDVSAIDPLGAVLTDRFCIEIKFYKDLDIAAFLLGRGNLARFWKQARVDARKYGKQPLLIAKQNLFPTLVLARTGTIPEKLVRWQSDRGGVVVALFDDMLTVAYTAPAVDRYRGG
jgi:hypothetical protein